MGLGPLVDALYSVRGVMRFARVEVTFDRIDFTENAEYLELTVDGERIHVTSTYLDSELSCPVDEFLASGTSFIHAELRRVIDAKFSLARNPTFRALAQEVAWNDLPA
jgi:hypothetical protein